MTNEQKDRLEGWLWLIAGAGFLCLLLNGCAFNRPVVTFQEVHTNGVTTIERVSVTSWALWPATSQLNKQKLSSGKTITIGTDALQQSGGGTNIVEALRALDSILGKIRP